MLFSVLIVTIKVNIVTDGAHMKAHITPQGDGHGPSIEERIALTKMIMKLFDHWQLSTREQLELLGLEPGARATLSRYRQKDGAFGNGRDLLERVGHLLSIHKSLRIIFPHNPELVYLWPKRRNTNFGNKTPVEFMQENGYTGVLMVRTYLDRERGR